MIFTNLVSIVENLELRNINIKTFYLKLVDIQMSKI